MGMLMPTISLVILVSALQYVGGAPSQLSPHILRQFSSPNRTITFNHLAVDRPTGSVFVTGVNRLYQFDSDLELVAEVITGPKLDNPLCHISGCYSPEAPLLPIDNTNKILIIDSENRTLIVCGSVLQGACEKYKVANISLPSEFIPKSIAANDNSSSTYAFIGPEQYSPLERSKSVLYVGTTFTNNGGYRHDVPAISSRNLYDLNFAEFSYSKQSQLMVDVKYRDHFLVTYVYGFNASEYAYFVIKQKRSHLPGEEEAGFLTRISRSCITDPNYDTYTEVTLQCLGPDGQEYNLIQDAKLVASGRDLAASLGISPGDFVLVGTFSPSDEHTMNPRQESAVCIYSMHDIERIFSENIHMCFNGTMKHRNLGYISGTIDDGKCKEPGTMGNIYNFCQVGLKISGANPIVQSYIWQDHVLITSLAVTHTQRHTVAFMGTQDGQLKKVVLKSSQVSSVYQSIEVNMGSPILPDLIFDPTGNFIFVPSKRTVSKVLVENCEEYTSCETCLKSQDPFCGWCSLEKRCTRNQKCQNATISSPRWLTPGQQCIEFEQVLPDRISIEQSTSVQLTIRTLPDLPFGKKYRCVFGNSSPIDAVLTSSGLSCMTPPLRQRPVIQEGEDHVSVPLSIRSSETQKDFVSRNFAFYDCTRHHTCFECVQSQWACNWCVYDNTCTHNGSSCQRTVISGENNPVQLVTHGRTHCPRISQPEDEILIPNGVKRSITLMIENLPRPQVGHTGFQCIIEIEGARMMLPATIESNKNVVCKRTMYSYEARTHEHKAKISVYWNRDHYVDTTTITLYKCELRPDCSLCVTAPSKYRCAWCGNSCSHHEFCHRQSDLHCPRPRIDVITPLQGPLEGGTLITIEGSNFGMRMEDVQGKISVGDIPCDLVEYDVSVKIVCRTGAAWKEMEAPVTVGNKVGYADSSVKFQYKNVHLESVHPNLGPQSGGTTLGLYGSNLNIGTEVKVYLDHLKCAVQMAHLSSTSLQCITPRADGRRDVARITLQIDNANRTIGNYPFSYVSDPTVMEIKPLRSFQSGGRVLTVHGTNLNSVQKPQLIIFSEGRPEPINSSICTVVSESYMHCPSPTLDRSRFYSSRYRRSSIRRNNRSPAKPLDPILNTRVGFKMDNVIMRNLRFQLAYVEDPVFQIFPNQIKSYKGDTLVIEGENLNLASDEFDVNVTIGSRPCNVTSLASSQLVCIPPDHQPPPTDEIGMRTSTGLPMVVVRVGTSLRFPIGYLRYDMIKPYNFPPEAIGGIAAGGFFLVLVSFVILLVYRRKSSQAEREYKRIQIQMDNLESNVRQECKQAFAELQTDMTDLTADLGSTGIPTLSHTMYVMKVFFPGVVEHPILADHKIRMGRPQTSYDIAMMQFEQLLNNKCFLVCFIETLETQKTFSIRDKVNVASLLLIILMNKMEYATDVLRALLLRLIDKSVNTKHPQLMLRRTESVVEKMLTNWMALCMYNYLKDRAGACLFLLYKAIKYQIEKGPVDSVVHDARYSLSEDRLLKEQIEHHVVTIHLVQEGPYYEKIPYQMYQTMPLPSLDDSEEKLQCRVLSCDSISQVKSKILDALYKNTPFSQRPSVDEIDLEWRHGRGGHLTLADEDLTTKKINGWKKLNTLAHYGISEAAIMSIVRRQNDIYSSEYASPYVTRIDSQHYNGVIENGHISNAYHLVRNIDDSSHFSESSHKAIPEIFLTRLLSTKGTIQKFVDDFFQTVLTVNDQLPPAVKWMFDLLDEASRNHNIMDPEVPHAWKSNSLPLRFWVNFIKNPDFIFDVEKTPTVDSCLSVIAQTFMDACSMSDHRLGKDSPSNKLLFAKDIPRYKEMVSKFYADVSSLPTITDQELNSEMHRLSEVHHGEFDVNAALKELYLYITKYFEAVVENLSADNLCRTMQLAQKLQNISMTMDRGETIVTC